MRRKLQFLPDRQAVLIEDSAGVRIDAEGAVESLVLEGLSDKEWAKLQASLATHDIVLDNDTKAPKLVKKPNKEKKS